MDATAEAAPQTVEHATATQISPELLDELRDWWPSGLDSTKRTAIMSRYALSFDEDFKLEPPPIDEWWPAQLKSASGFKQVDTEDKALSSVQHKVLDIMAPLLHAYSSLLALPVEESNKDARAMLEPIRAAMSLTASAANDITRRRRKNYLEFASPHASYLLSKERAFAKREISQALFGERFFRTLSQAAKLNTALLDMGQLATPGPTTRSRTRAGASSSRSAAKRSSGRKRYVPFDCFPPHLAFSVPETVIGGRLRFLRLLGRIFSRALGLRPRYGRA